MAYLWQGQAFLLAGVLGTGDCFTPGAEPHGSASSFQKDKQELRSEQVGGVFLSFWACSREKHWGPRAWEGTGQGAVLSTLLEMGQGAGQGGT